MWVRKIKMSFHSKQQIFTADFRNDFEEAMFFCACVCMIYRCPPLLMTRQSERRPFIKQSAQTEHAGIIAT